MTCQEITTPNTDTEPAPQPRGDDPCDIGNIPDFLRRTPGDARLTNMARFAASHGFRVELIDGGIVVYIPWIARDGSTGETGETARTWAELRNVLGY